MRSFLLSCLVGIAAAADIEQYSHSRSPWGARPYDNYANHAHSHDHSHDDLDDDIDDAQAEILRLQGLLSDVEDKCDAQSTDIATLQGQVLTINGWVEPLHDNSIQNASDIAGLQASLPTLQTQVNDLENDLQAEKIKIAVLQSQVGTITDLETRLTTLENLVSTELTTLGSRLTTLESDVSTLGTDISTNSAAIGTLQTSVTDLQTQATDLQTAITSFENQKVLSDYFAVNDADITVDDTTGGAQTDANYNLLEFCSDASTFVEVWAVANIPAADTGIYVKSMQLLVDGTVVAADTKLTAPAAANEDRSFVIFYRTQSTGSGNEFDLNLVYDSDASANLVVPQQQLSMGYRTYASGYPTVSSAATCS